ncbi:MAG: molybdenum cofactor guanylyltransferase MobA [Rhodospirillales bacterium]|nr:MAG: molybdenum cofactor guanylyltransferase MobA [Rhodospirillales bacterium]
MTGIDPGPPVLGVLLAGGQARRLGGGDKCLQRIGGDTLLERVLARAAPQVPHLLINAGGDPARFRRFGLPVVADVIGGFQGPLAGILTGLEWAERHLPECRFVATFATDTPFLPSDLVVRLQQAVEPDRADLSLAASGGRTHPVFGLWPVRLAAALRQAMTGDGVRKIDAWTARYRVATVAFPTGDGDPFFNVNAPEDLAEATARLAAAAGTAGTAAPHRPP